MKTREKLLLAVAGLWLAFAPVCWFILPGARFFGAFCIGVAVLCLLGLLLGRLAEKSQVGRLALGAFRVCLLLGLISFVLVEGLLLYEGKQDNLNRPADALLVLGAGVNGTTPSLALRTRIDAAAAYLERHPQTLAVLSGGQGSGEDITEAEAMYRALIALGIASERLLREGRSTSTAENFAYSKDVLLAAGLDTETAVVAVVSNDFHLYRARLLATRQGMETFGVSAELPWFWLSANYYIREYFALVKSVIFD